MRLLADKATAPFSAVDVTGNYRAVHQAWTSSTWGKPLVAVELSGSSKMLLESEVPASSLRQRQFLKTEVYLLLLHMNVLLVKLSCQHSLSRDKTYAAFTTGKYKV